MERLAAVSHGSLTGLKQSMILLRSGLRMSFLDAILSRTTRSTVCADALVYLALFC
jgi:hypothetical protein